MEISQWNRRNVEKVLSDNEKINNEGSIMQCKLTHLCVREVVVGLKCRVQGGNQVEQSLSADGVAESHSFIAWVTSTAEERRHVRQGLGRRKSLQVWRRVLGRDEALVELLVVAGHLAAVTLDSAEDRSVAGLDGERIVDRLEVGWLEQFHLELLISLTFLFSFLTFEFS